MSLVRRIQRAMWREAPYRPWYLLQTRRRPRHWNIGGGRWVRKP